MSATNDVQQVSSRFYAALNRMMEGDAGAMAEVWSHGATVSTMHPIGGCEVGWAQVKEPWAQIAKLAAGGQVRLERRLLEVVGDLAYEVGTELGSLVLAGQTVPIDHRVTNIYRREGGAWKVAHHHTDLSPTMLDVLRTLQARTP